MAAVFAKQHVGSGGQLEKALETPRQIWGHLNGWLPLLAGLLNVHSVPPLTIL